MLYTKLVETEPREGSQLPIHSQELRRGELVTREATPQGTLWQWGTLQSTGIHQPQQAEWGHGTPERHRLISTDGFCLILIPTKCERLLKPIRENSTVTNGFMRGSNSYFRRRNNVTLNV